MTIGSAIVTNSRVTSKNEYGSPATVRYLGAQGLARAWVIAQQAAHHPVQLVICRDRRSAEDLLHDISFFVRDRAVLHLSGWETLPFEQVSPELDVSAARLHIAEVLSQSSPAIVVAAAEAVSQRFLPRHVLNAAAFAVERGAQVDHEQLLQRFVRAGFKRVSLVEEVGDFAVRGAVFDFFPGNRSEPVRIEFLADTIESIRTFDAETQRSRTELERARIFPVREAVDVRAILSPQEFDAAIERIKARGKELDVPPREVARVVAALKSGSLFPAIELAHALAIGKLETIFDLLPPNAHVVLDDSIAVEHGLLEAWQLVEERAARLSQEHQLLPPPELLFAPPQEVLEYAARFPRALLNHLEILEQGEAQGEKIQIRSLPNTELSVRLKSKVGSGNALAPLAQSLTRWRRDGMLVAFVVGSMSRAERLQRLLLDLTIEARIFEDLSGSDWLAVPHRAPVAILLGEIAHGVQLPEQHAVFVAESEIFSERSHRKPTRTGKNIARLLSSIAQLKDGDFVVHTDYGIGVYHGLVHLTVQGSQSDFLHIEYADSRLYLPVQQIGKVQKFSAAEGKVPVLDKLSSNRWQRTKAKVRESVVSLAGDLIKLYASRSVAKGWRFEPPGAEDERFADGFPYEVTPDQGKAIEQTLLDMASDRPTDRLVCGDVGFGKTEVALRAAFKCTQHARQVAVLVPTTVLVEQHRANFTERFLGYDVKVGAVSRFYDAKTNRETLEKVASGEIDIIIGTHRLLSRDVQFKDLGLLIIDEEHRFGVKQKERLKQLKRQVDVLTLTATPIPRTMHMSLLGIRDISVISTPPVDRRVTRTYVATRSEGLIRDAIVREVQRGGQCFFVFNRVQGIELVTAELRDLVPEARFEWAHGQMSETELENRMRRFMDHEVDVLVTTTIVESGIDIPNANTIIIDRADTFGLAQLYQLRGRVGRSSRQAFCYLLVPPARKLGSEAQQRLKVLQALDDLGIGFNLAMRDMEIRGAGNLLGKEQSGNVLAVGFDLYTRILKEAVLNLKGEELPLEEAIDPEVKLGIDAYIPDSYIPDVAERLVLYQRLAALDDPSRSESLEEEMVDRFGPFGPEVRNLLEVMRIRALLRQFGGVHAELARGRLQLAFSPNAPIDTAQIVKLVQTNPDKYRFTRGLALSVALDEETLKTPRHIFNALERLLRRLARTEDTAVSA